MEGVKQMKKTYSSWPDLPYEAFSDTRYLLHMLAQMIGKLKLETPFESHFSNVVLWPTSSGISSGLIPYHEESFSIDINLRHHEVQLITSWNFFEKFALRSCSVANLYRSLFAMLSAANIDLSINPIPQELTSQPIPFDQDNAKREYNKELAVAWWRILLSSYLIMMRYHAKFHGESPPMGLMWGTFDLRDARYNGVVVKPTGDSDYIRRNSMDEQQVEIGWWPGNELYPRPAYYSFTFPEPKGLEEAKIKPDRAHFDNKLREFIIDYDDIRHSDDPGKDLLEFFDSAYEAGITRAGWKNNLLISGKPV
jgi:Family of unknown function (DUF5996)